MGRQRQIDSAGLTKGNRLRCGSAHAWRNDSGAHRREILRVREEHGPGIAYPVVEADFAFGRLRLEIRRGVIDCKSHYSPPLQARKGWPRDRAAERLHCRLAGVTRQSAFRCGAPSPLSFRVLKRTTAPGTRLRALIRLRPVPVNT